MEVASQKLIRRAVIIAALGYFIDVFDIQLFAVLRVASLTDLGVSADRIPAVGGTILNLQMLGMVLGGFLWGWLGDRYGRLRALYGSILIYSIGSLLCSTVHSTTTYGVYRFITGFGLAGETGAAVTLIAELMPANRRSLGIMIMGGFAFLGPTAAVGISLFLDWRTTYIVAGLMGLALLVLRKSLTEPLLYTKLNQNSTSRGSWKFLANRKAAIAFMWCFLMGAPLSYSWNMLNFYSNEVGHSMVSEPFNQKFTLLAFYFGTVSGDFLSGWITQIWRSRRKTIAAFLAANWIISALLLIGGPLVGITPYLFYLAYFLIGTSSGFWILMTTVAAEHFGTNIRATTATVVTNLVRGFTIPLIISSQALKPVTGLDNGAVLIGLVIFPLAFLAISRLNETHGIDLDYLETP